MITAKKEQQQHQKEKKEKKKRGCNILKFIKNKK